MLLKLSAIMMLMAFVSLVTSCTNGASNGAAPGNTNPQTTVKKESGGT